MSEEKKRPGGLTDEQLLTAIRALVSQTRAAGSSLSSAEEAAAAGETAASVGHTILHIVEDVVGAAAFVIAEVATDFDDSVLDTVLNVTEHVVEHIIVDIILYIIEEPLTVDVLQAGQLAGVIRERVAHAKLAMDMATQKGPAPSSRELALLRQIILKKQGSSRTGSKK